MKLKNGLMLVLTAFIWGVAFVSQTVGMDHVGPFAFNSLRFLIGGMVLLPVIFLRRKKSPLPRDNQGRKALLLGGAVCGVVLAAASAFQQFGLFYGVPTGKAGFITALYIVLVPLLGLLFRKKVGLQVWIGVVLAALGLYFLCMTSGFSEVAIGDVMLMVCALLYAVHILVVDHFAPRTDGIQLACVQFLVAGVCQGILMACTEEITWAGICAAWIPLLYSGLLATGVGFTFQIIGQKGMNPTVASLLMSLESVFAVLAGWVLLEQTLSLREWLGILLMGAAILLAQLPSPRKKPKTAE